MCDEKYKHISLPKGYTKIYCEWNLKYKIMNKILAKYGTDNINGSILDCLLMSILDYNIKVWIT